MRNKLLILSCTLFFSSFVWAQQNFWTRYNGITVENERERTVAPEDFKLMKLNLEGMKQQLLYAAGSQTEIRVKFPTANGQFETFRLKENSVMHPALQAKYPNIKSYSGFSESNRLTSIRLSISPYFGLNALIRNKNQETYIDSYTTTNNLYIVYSRDSLQGHVHDFSCGHTSDHLFDVPGAPVPDLGTETVQDGQMRKYRLALATTIEYTEYIATLAGVENGSDEDIKAAVMEALNVAVARLNEVYENDMSLTMELVPNNDEVIFIHSDNYNPFNAGAMLGQNQTTLDNIIGSANYDIGHVFFRANAGNDNGVAYLRSVCNNSYKAGGVTGAGNPIGDPFVIDYVAHEMGHQYGANHTQNNGCNRNNATAVEPGSASTIMGYAGICNPNVQMNSDAYFHAVSVAEMYNWVTTGGNCGDNTETANNAPVLESLENKTIPKETPFAITAIAEDEDGDVLTYAADQTDYQTAQMPPRPTNTGGPMFRSVFATESNVIYFPRLSTIIEGYDPNNNNSGNYRAWEKLSSVNRQLNFAVFVRDNNPAGGQSARQNVRLTVNSNAGPFVVTSQTENETWETGSEQTISWDVAGTDEAPVSTENVEILISTDGGETFSYTLIESTPNNGSYTFSVPEDLESTEEARIMVKAVDNYFLNVNSSDFTIDSNMAAIDQEHGLFAIYPNPSNGIFTIEMETQTKEVSYTLYNLEGKRMAAQKINSLENRISEQVNMSHLPSGTYVIQVTDGTTTRSAKLIIK